MSRFTTTYCRHGVNTEEKCEKCDAARQEEVYAPIVAIIKSRLGEFMDIHPPGRGDTLMRHLAQEIFVHLRPEGEPPIGWKLVPIEPTHAMMEAGVGVKRCYCSQNIITYQTTANWPEILDAVSETRPLDVAPGRTLNATP